MLEAQNISYAIKDKEILHSISTSFSPGKLSVIIGPNGSGKSTFLRLLSNEVQPTTGTVLLHGRKLPEFDAQALARQRAVLSQRVEIQFPLTVEEIVLMGRYPYFSAKPTARDHEIVKLALERVGFWELRLRTYQTLSGGEQQMVQFARILSQIWQDEKQEDSTTAAKCLLLDEPTTFLDLHHQHTILQLARTMAADGLIVVAVIHDLNLALQYADLVYAMHRGSLLTVGTKHDVITPEIIYTMYGLRSEVITHGQNAAIVIP